MSEDKTINALFHPHSFHIPKLFHFVCLWDDTVLECRGRARSLRTIVPFSPLCLFLFSASSSDPRPLWRPPCRVCVQMWVECQSDSLVGAFLTPKPPPDPWRNVLPGWMDGSRWKGRNRDLLTLKSLIVKKYLLKNMLFFFFTSAHDVLLFPQLVIMETL